MSDQLIPKLEKLALPEIDLPGHRVKLRRFLLERYSGQRQATSVFSLFWRLATLASISLAVLLFWLVGSPFSSGPDKTFIKEIAVLDPRVESLIDQGAIIKEIQATKEKSYVLLEQFPVPSATPLTGALNLVRKEKAMSLPSADQEQPFIAPREESAHRLLMVEIDVQGKRVLGIKKIK